MANPLGYLTENAQTSYPFKDGSSLKPRGVSTPLANDVFLDFQLSTSDTTLKKVALIQLRTYSSGYGNTMVASFGLYKQNATTGEWSRTTISFSKTATELQSLGYGGFITASAGTYKAKLVTGPGLLRLLALPVFSYVFDADGASNVFAAELTPSTVHPVQPAVTRVHFKNVKESSDTANIAMSGNVTLEAGSNMFFESLTSATGMNVKKGTGSGLFDPCTDLPTDVIKSINGISGEDFTFVSGDCYKTIPVPASNQLSFEHTCRPKCTQTEVNAFAYYANRVQDAVNKMGDYVSSVVSGLTAQIAAMEAEKASQVVSPYLDIQTAATTFNSRIYESIGIGLYDPNKSKLSGTLTVYMSDGIVDDPYFQTHPEWTSWVLYPASTTLQEDNSTFVLPATVHGDHDRVSMFSSRGIDCRGSAIANLIASTPSSKTDEWVKAVLTTDAGTAFKYHTLLPSARPYFNVRSRRGTRTVSGVATYVHTVTVELFNANPAWSGNTSFSAVVSSAHTVKSPQLRVNSGVPEAITLSNKTVSFSDKTISYPNRAVVTFQLEHTSAATVNVTLQHTVGAQQFTLSALTFQ